MVKEIVIYLEDLNFISIFLRVLMAVIFGGIIGYGREREKRPAGLRTHILVSVGATLAMITNIYLHKKKVDRTNPIYFFLSNKHILLFLLLLHHHEHFL